MDPKQDAQVADVLKLVPRPPDPWPKAREALREAEWAVFVATTIQQAEKVYKLRSSIRGLEALDLPTGSLPIILEAEEEILAAVNKVEAERLRTRAERTERRRALAQIISAINYARERGLPVTAEDLQPALNAQEAVNEDAVAAASERAEVDALRATVDECLASCRAILANACRSQVAQYAHAYADTINPKAELWVAFPNEAPGAELLARLRWAAGKAAGYGLSLDVDATVLQHLSAAGREAYFASQGRLDPAKERFATTFGEAREG